MCRSHPCNSPAPPGSIGTPKGAGSTADLQRNPSLESYANPALAVVNRVAHARTEEPAEEHAPAQHRGHLPLRAVEHFAEQLRATLARQPAPPATAAPGPRTSSPETARLLGKPGRVGLSKLDGCSFTRASTRPVRIQRQRNTSLRPNFSRFRISSIFLNVALWLACSSRNSVDGAMPSFLANWE